MTQAAYLRTLVVFAFRHNPLLYVSVVLSAGSVLVEMAAMLTLFPLLSVASGRPVPMDSLPVRALEWLGVPPVGRVLLLAFVLLFAARVVTQFGGQGLTQYLSKRMMVQLATTAFHSLVRSVPLKEVERATIGSYITLVGDESFRASNVVAYLNQLVSLALLAALYLGAVFLYSPSVGASVVVFLAVTFALMLESLRLSHRLGARQVDQSQSASSLFLDSLNGLRSVRAFAAENYVADGYRKLMTAYMRTLVSIDLISLTTRLGPALLLLTGVAVVSAWPTLAARLSLDFTFLLTVIILLMRFFPVAGNVLNLALRVISDARAGRDVTHLIREYPVTTQPAAGLASLDGPIHDIEAQAITFAHEGEKLVLQDVGLTLERGKSYALAGLSGSGKSTFLDILMGFYLPRSGNLRINGIPAERIPVDELRSRIVLVSQDTTIFNDTIANNIRFGAEASDEQVEQACRVACIHEFVVGLPQGYQSVLSYRGANLSGGQKQRIGLARAILRAPDVLLLDESTSALDMETREGVVENLLDYGRARIILFVTHDRWLMSRADVVLDMGQLNRAGAVSTAAALSREQVS